jgi:2-methylcitrate dehydratase PrpD
LAEDISNKCYIFLKIQLPPFGHTVPLEGSGKTAPAFIHDVRSTDVPADVMHVARRCLVDTLAIWASGIATEPSRIAREHAVRRYGGGDVKMPFDGRAVNPVGYAFAGAATIDAIDGHDGHQPSKGHAGVAIHPSLLAELGQAPDCTMDDLLADLIVGYEVAIRAALSLHATVPDYHSSGAWNALGCVAIAARLRGFTTEQTRHSLGIAEYYGPRAQMMRCIEHSSMVKDSSSWGALTGISAADLAEDGFTGAPAITCEAPEVSEIWGDLGTHWRILESNFKAYPVCP